MIANSCPETRGEHEPAETQVRGAVLVEVDPDKAVIWGQHGGRPMRVVGSILVCRHCGALYAPGITT